MDAGTTIPPIAAAIGSAAYRADLSSPTSTSLDLQPDQQKEDGHQPVVDPLMKRE